MTMASTFKRREGIDTSAPGCQGEASEGMHLVPFCALEEAVGLIFGVMTVASIVLSLFALKPRRATRNRSASRHSICRIDPVRDKKDSRPTSRYIKCL